jgi:hypothetical protein
MATADLTPQAEEAAPREIPTELQARAKHLGYVIHYMDPGVWEPKNDEVYVIAPLAAGEAILAFTLEKAVDHIEELMQQHDAEVECSQCHGRVVAFRSRMLYDLPLQSGIPVELMVQVVARDRPDLVTDEPTLPARNKTGWRTRLCEYCASEIPATGAFFEYCDGCEERENADAEASSSATTA